MMKTKYEFTLPRGYLDAYGNLHRDGVMRLATARDELEPLRDPTVSGPDDPRLTIVVLARVVERLGSLDLVTTHEIEGLFAVDLAFLQDFYGVVNFGTPQEYEALMASQRDLALVGQSRPAAEPLPAATTPAQEAPGPATVLLPASTGDGPGLVRASRAAIEEISSDGR